MLPGNQYVGRGSAPVCLHSLAYKCRLLTHPSPLVSPSNGLLPSLPHSSSRFKRISLSSLFLIMLLASHNGASD